LEKSEIGYLGAGYLTLLRARSEIMDLFQRVSGGVPSLVPTRLCGQFPDNREKYRENPRKLHFSNRDFSQTLCFRAF
jgi:hypothetical protein